MKVATTKEFRNAVRLAVSSCNAYVCNSWTDPVNRWTYRDPKRYVCFDIGGAPSEKVAEQAESILNAVGLTAGARSKPRDPTAYSNYVRGTCVVG